LDVEEERKKRLQPPIPKKGGVHEKIIDGLKIGDPEFDHLVKKKKTNKNVGEMLN